jgi:hypothetical protein
MDGSSLEASKFSLFLIESTPKLGSFVSSHVSKLKWYIYIII